LDELEVFGIGSLPRPISCKKILKPNKRDSDDSFSPGSVDGKSGENGGNIRGKIGENVFPWFT
jgi:hypothetical protein